MFGATTRSPTSSGGSSAVVVITSVLSQVGPASTLGTASRPSSPVTACEFNGIPKAPVVVV